MVLTVLTVLSVLEGGHTYRSVIGIGIGAEPGARDVLG